MTKCFNKSKGSLADCETTISPKTVHVYRHIPVSTRKFQVATKRKSRLVWASGALVARIKVSASGHALQPPAPPRSVRPCGSALALCRSALLLHGRSAGRCRLYHALWFPAGARGGEEAHGRLRLPQGRRPVRCLLLCPSTAQLSPKADVSLSLSLALTATTS